MRQSGGCVRQVDRAPEVSSSRDKLIGLVVRDIARLSPGKETSPLNCLSGDGSTSLSANTSFWPTRAQILRLLRPKTPAFVVRDLRSFRFMLPILLLMSGLAQAQTAPPPSADIQRERVEQLQELLRTKKDLQASQQAMQQQLAEFDARIAALEASLGVTPSQDERPQGDSEAIAATAATSTAALASPGGMVSAKASDQPYQEVRDPLRKSTGFPYESPLGFVLARGPNGEVDFSTKGYVRYLNQLDLDPTYTDAFGRTFELDLRQDIQLE